MLHFSLKFSRQPTVSLEHLLRHLLLSLQQSSAEIQFTIMKQERATVGTRVDVGLGPCQGYNIIMMIYLIYGLHYIEGIPGETPMKSLIIIVYDLLHHMTYK